MKKEDDQLTCSHDPPQFGCPKCVAKARPNALNKAVAKGGNALRDHEREMRNRQSEAAARARIREQRRIQRRDAAQTRAHEHRMQTCGHVEIEWGCQHCAESHNWYIRVAGADA